MGNLTNDLNRIANDPTKQRKKEVKVKDEKGVVRSYFTDSSEYRKIYDTGRLVGIDKDGTINAVQSPAVEVTAEAPAWLKQARYLASEEANRNAYRNMGANIANPFFEGLKTASEFTGIPGAVRFVKDPVKSLTGVANTLENIILDSNTMPQNVIAPSEYKSEDVEGLFNTLDAVGIGALVKNPFMQGIKQTGKYLTKSPLKNTYNTNYKIGNYQNILDKNLDIHDIRLKYHNNMILDLDELDMINKYGKGNVANYKNADPTNLSDSFLDFYGTLLETKDTKIPNKEDFNKIFFGEDFDKINIPEKEISENFQKNIDEPKELTNVEQNIVKPKPKWNIENIINGIYKGPYERTKESRLADKWLTEWYDNPTSKQRFLDYGGTEKGWTEVLNSLENPIRAGKPYPKSLNNIGGLYNTNNRKASINTGMSKKEQIPIGVHEGAHKTNIVDKNYILKKGPSGLINLYNDITDASKLKPEETYSEIIRMRYMQGWKPETVVTMDMLEKGLNELGGGYMMALKIKDKNKLLKIINKAPALIPGAVATGIGTQMLPYIKYNNGGRIGPDNPYVETNDYVLPEVTITAPKKKEKYNSSLNPFDLTGVVKNNNRNKEKDSVVENIMELIDPTGRLSYDDAQRAYNEYKQSKRILPNFDQALDMFGAVPTLGKFGKFRYIANLDDLQKTGSNVINLVKPIYKLFPWQDALNTIGTSSDVLEDNVSTKKLKPKSKYGSKVDKLYKK